MIVITGGAGLIGSALAWALNRQGRSDLILVDDIDHKEKEHNLGPLIYESIVSINEFRGRLRGGGFNQAVEAVFHLGACTDTTESDWEYLRKNNVEYTKDVIRWCAERGVRCVYASSAAVYGDGALGFSDDHNLFTSLSPLNYYGHSKLEVDRWANDEGYLDKVVGLRYFNVFGPNEWHKGLMRSVVAKKFPRLQQAGYIELFKSEDPTWADGEQERDFMYIKDAVSATLFFLDRRELAGVYNIGTGRVQTWNQVARALFAAVGQGVDIRYIDLPANLREQYQYHTQADISKLRAVGWGGDVTVLEDSVADYVQNYLIPHRHLGKKI